jgi:hypothetical protein
VRQVRRERIAWEEPVVTRLQHNGVMTRGAQSLSVTVVPDSGTGGLKGLSGRMTIRIVDLKHFYDFAFEVTDGPEVPT